MESEKKYIAVDVLRAALNTEIADVVATYADYEESGFSRDALNKIIDNLPQEEVAPVVHAKWIERRKYIYEHYYELLGYDCSVCEVMNKKYNPPFCPHCGAKMDLEVEF